MTYVLNWYLYKEANNNITQCLLKRILFIMERII